VVVESWVVICGFCEFTSAAGTIYLEIAGGVGYKHDDAGYYATKEGMRAEG